MLATLLVSTWSSTCHYSDDTIGTNAVDGDMNLGIDDDAKCHHFYVRFQGQQTDGTPRYTQLAPAECTPGANSVNGGNGMQRLVECVASSDDIGAKYG